jgi:hypothetical protein
MWYEIKLLKLWFYYRDEENFRLSSRNVVAFFKKKEELISFIRGLIHCTKDSSVYDGEFAYSILRLFQDGRKVEIPNTLREELYNCVYEKFYHSLNTKGREGLRNQLLGF